MTNDQMPFLQHLEELRRRFIICAIAVGVGFAVCFFFKEIIFAWLMEPMIKALPHGDGELQKLIYTAPHEAFMTYLKVSLFAGIGLAMPVILYQIWGFVAPGLYHAERRYIVPVMFFSVLFFAGGASFAYFVVFPFAFEFFTSFANEYITPMISTREYLTFAVRFLLAFGIIFELPIFVFFLAKLGLVTAQFLRKQRRYAIVLIFVVAAILTPTPDVFNQCLMAGPLLILYEVSIWIAHFVAREKVHSSAGQEQPGPVD